MQSDVYWLWLSLLNISAKARACVIGHFGTAESVFLAGEGCFNGLNGISPKEASQLELKSLTSAERSLERCYQLGINILPITAPDYPSRLKQIFLPPPVLYIQGVLPAVDELPVISVIGTRRASPYGVKMGQKMAYEISKCGGTVLSLLTSGVDEAAARGALKSGRPLISVLGTDHDRRAGELLREVSAYGSVISEYPPEKKPSKLFFRERNRIAAGLSVGVVVVEAPEKSGTRFFVYDAIEQGKDVFAVPGNADAANSVGTLSLLKEGAKLVTCGSDVMEEYELRFPEHVCLESLDTFCEEDEAEDSTKPEISHDLKQSASVEREMDLSTLRKKLVDLTDEQLHILQYIDTVPNHIDEISDQAGLPVPKVLAQLTVLEIKGIISRRPGKYFCLKD